MKATIYHNPRCSKSREALRLLEDAGAEITVVEYLRKPPSADTLGDLFARAPLAPADALRAEGAHLRDKGEPAILQAMAAEPALIERPIVETEQGVVLARPPERVREIL